MLEDGRPDDMIRVYDVVGFVVGGVDGERDGAPSGFDDRGGEGFHEGHRDAPTAAVSRSTGGN